MEAQDLIFILISLILAIVLFYLYVWLLPVIAVVLIAFFLYIFLKNRYNERI